MPKVQVPPEATVANTASGLSPEAEDRFELELSWCIQQLQMNSSTGKIQKKHAQVIEKHLQSLKSNNVSLIKKRQIMRSTLGDYREKMLEDERKLNKVVSAVKFLCSAPNEKSKFIKRAARHNTEKSLSRTDDETQDKSSNTKAIIDTNETETPFRFNFQR